MKLYRKYREWAINEWGNPYGGKANVTFYTVMGLLAACVSLPIIGLLLVVLFPYWLLLFPIGWVVFLFLRGIGAEAERRKATEEMEQANAHIEILDDKRAMEKTLYELRKIQGERA